MARPYDPQKRSATEIRLIAHSTPLIKSLLKYVGVGVGVGVTCACCHMCVCMSCVCVLCGVPVCFLSCFACARCVRRVAAALSLYLKKKESFIFEKRKKRKRATATPSIALSSLPTKCCLWESECLYVRE